MTKPQRTLEEQEVSRQMEEAAASGAEVSKAVERVKEAATARATEERQTARVIRDSKTSLKAIVIPKADTGRYEAVTAARASAK